MAFDLATAKPVGGFDLASAKPVITPQQAAVAAQSPSFADQLMNAGAELGSAAARPIVKAVSGLPLMAMDAGVAARNLVSNLRQGITPTLADFNPFAKTGGTPQEYALPSTTFNQALNSVTREPQGIVGKGAEFVNTALAGARLPAPEAAQQAPANFKPMVDLTPQQQTFQAGREAGYVAPPATVKPTLTNQIAESIAGKAATQQAASIRNQQVTNELAAQSLELPAGTQITPKVLSGLRAQAGGVYKEVAQSGRITTDAQYADDLAQILKEPSQIAADFPEATVAASDKIEKLVSSLQRESFDAKSAMAYMRMLRQQASGNINAARIAGGDPEKMALGMAQRDAAGALEDMVVRHLGAQGKEDLAASFDRARTLIAKTHSVEDALNPATGNIVARDLAGQLNRNKPLSGGLKVAGDFARAFPKAVEEVKHSGPVSALDAIPVGLAAYLHNPYLLAAPAARIAMRYGLLAPTVQDALLPGASLGIPPGAIMGGASLYGSTPR